MSSSNALVLFSVITLLSLASASAGGTSNMWKRALGKIASKTSKKIHHDATEATSSSASTSSEGPPGQLITVDSQEFRDGSWKSIVSVDHGFDLPDPKCDIEFINELDAIVVLCWVAPTGELFHHYPINDRSIRDGSVSNIHDEFSQAGHAFVCLKRSSRRPSHMRDIPAQNFICLYVPHRASSRHSLRLCTDSPSTEDAEPSRATASSAAGSAAIARETSASLRGSHGRKNSGRGRKSSKAQLELPLKKVRVVLSCVPSAAEEAVVDTSTKVYLPESISGFIVHCEPGVFDCVEGLRDTLQCDLDAVSTLLPPRLLLKLQRDTAFWLNRSISYGPVSSPTVGTTCTYHPQDGAEWLRRVGMTTAKCGSVELFSAEEYLSSRGLWGTGGLLLHELCHCVHDKYCPGGYENAEVQKAYLKAMDRGLYENVAVHGPQGEGGRLAKAYACANCMEFFAELSVAFLWKADDNHEFNKWFPFNSGLLLKHDPSTFEALQVIWQSLEQTVSDP